MVPKSAAKVFFPRDSRTAVVNEPSVFEPLEFYCIYKCVLLYYIMYKCVIKSQFVEMLRACYVLIIPFTVGFQ